MQPPQIRECFLRCLPWMFHSLAVTGLLVVSARAELPPGWANQDIGSPAIAGSATWSPGQWTLTGGGAETCGTNTQFHFAWIPFNGDGAIIARVMSMSNGTSVSEAGIIVRSDLSPGAPQAGFFVRTNTSLWFRTRTAQQATCVVQGAAPRGQFVWLKLERSGKTFTASHSPDRQTWTQLGSSQTVGIGTRAVAGFAVCSYSEASACSAVFSELAVERPLLAVFRQGWLGLNPAAGDSLNSLTNTAWNPKWPEEPDPALDTFLPEWDTGINSGLTHYGQRLRAFIVPPVDGPYVFSISSHHASELRLSPDEKAESATAIASVNNGTLPREWYRETNQTSAVFALRAGKRYYLESRVQHFTGVDHLTVRWQRPDNSFQEPIPAVSAGWPQLIPYLGPAETSPGIFLQPTNTFVAEGGTASLRVLITNPAPATYQWQLNGTNLAIAAARDSVLTLSNLTVALRTNDFFACVISNPAGSTTSAVASIQVIPDVDAPALSRLTYETSTKLRLVFSEPLDRESATNHTNYILNGTASVVAAALLPDQLTVDLATSPLTEGQYHELAISGVRDASYNQNLMVPVRVPFFSSLYAPVGIGAPQPPGTISGTPDGGIDLTGGGSDIGSLTDQFQFAYRVREGDFDVRVRVESLGQTDAYAKAGLMAREDLNANSRYAASLTTPTIAGAFFSARSFAGSRATSSGMVPVSYPDMWLRLQRQGSTFNGYASYDGQLWQPLGTATLELSNAVYLGFAVSSRNTSATTLARFRDISDVTTAITGRVAAATEPVGPSSRKTALAITEIMYHPQDRVDARDLEFVEILNTQPFFEDISGFKLTGDIEYTFPPGTLLPSGAYAVVAAVPTDVEAVYGMTPVYGPYAKRLSNGGGRLRLEDRFGAVLLDVQFGTAAPWPVAADGAGHSLVLAKPSYGENDPRAWRASGRKGGSPGNTDAPTRESASGVVINEFLAHTDPPLFDQIELFNRITTEVDISGCYLTDNAQVNKFRIPAGTRIPPRGFAVFDEAQLGFRLDAAGESIFLVNASNTVVLDAIAFRGQANGVSSGRYPDGEEFITELAATSMGRTNALPLLRDVVINEIMYNPISGDSRDEFVELYNKGTQSISLAGWRFIEGIGYQFPPGIRIAADGFVVVAKDPDRLRANHPQLNSSNLVGPFSGALSGQGERLTLAFPEPIVSTNTSGVVQTNVVDVAADEVAYGTGGRWGQWSDGGGSSLELVNPQADNRLAPNWADSDETGKAGWTTVEHTGTLEYGLSSYPADQLQIILQGAGECLVDNVEVARLGSTNRVRNSTFDAGTANWFFQGTHRWTSHAPSGGVSGAALHLRASGRGDTGANRTRGTLTQAIPFGDVATLRAQVRWLKGNPEILLRLKGNWLEAPKRLDVPGNLGTPGSRNSRFQPSVGPAITEVAHGPVLPTIDEPVTITARVSDPDDLAQVQLVYRNDSASGPTLVAPMRDDGTQGDAFPGDGVFTATIPAHGAKAMFAFYVEAQDRDGAASRFPNDAPARECLVQTGEQFVSGSLGSYRLWVNKANTAHWAAREKNSNDPVDCTFVYGNARVVYNMQALYSGSPFHTGSYNSPVGSACDYALIFPDDDRVLGARDFVIATLGNLNNDGTAQREQAAFWMLREMGVPTLNRRFIFMFVNGARRGTAMEDSQQPNSDVLEEYFPDDSEGNLYKIEDWFEFDNSGSSFAHVDATLENFLSSDGGKRMARYRWAWRPRAVQGSYSDFTNLFQLVDALQLPQPEPYTSAVESLVDVDEWMRVFALERIVGNWDSFSYSRGKNMYAYKPRNGRWNLLAWDIDFVLGLGDGPTSGLFGGQDWPTAMMKWHPPFERAYWRAFYDALNGPMQASRIGAVVDAKYYGLQANGVNVTTPQPILTYVSQRRNYLQSQLGSVAAAFSLNNPTLSGNVAEITGRAPVQVKTLLFNGVAYPVTWNGVTDWRAQLPLQTGSNVFQVTGLDSWGKPVPGVSRQVTINYTSPVPSPAGQVVFNEVMIRPGLPGAEFVELYNTSTLTAFDLSGWRVNGLAYTFPAGTVLAPLSYLVLASDRTQFGEAYGLDRPAFDTFTGRLQPDGETLTLISTDTNAPTVTRVRYEGGPPWPSAPGKSMQLRDARVDPWRAGNWGNPESSGGTWQYFTLTATVGSSLLYVYLESPGDVFIDDLKLVSGNRPEAGPNYIANGSFETAFPGPWTVSANHAESFVTSKASVAGTNSLYMRATTGGSTQGSSVWQVVSPTLTIGGTYTLSFWYMPADTKTTLTLRLSNSALRASVQVAPQPILTRDADPGRANAVASLLPAFPTLWINELQPENVTGITNGLGQRVPWIEVFNPSTNAVPLGGLFLSDNYTNLTQWAFPSNSVLAPGQFKVVFTDGLTNQSTTNELHANFVLRPGLGELALSRLYQGTAQVLDYVNYAGVRPDRSFGSLPDAQSFDRQEFFLATPGATNDATPAPIRVFINEWMADNSTTLADPEDGDYEDWFELYNAGAEAADIGGFYLTDSTANKTQFQVPNNGRYVIPPGGFLIVWADGEPNQNSTNQPQLHTNFRLDRAGESIGLFGPDGSTVDVVTFGPQQTDKTQGRFPDGSSSVGILAFPTPGSANAGGNTVPVLEPIPDQFYYAGQFASLAVVATDPDLPPQTLTYMLGAGAPPNATLHPSTGVFTWQPSFVVGTNLLSLTVTDNGQPNLSSSRTFRVVVLPLPQIRPTLTADGKLKVALQTVAGQQYQIFKTEDLSNVLWVSASEVIVGTGAMLEVELPWTNNGTAFYRLIITR